MTARGDRRDGQPRVRGRGFAAGGRSYAVLFNL